MSSRDLPLRALEALCPDVSPSEAEALGPQVWRLGQTVLKCVPQADLPRFRRIVRAHRQAGRIFRGHARLGAQRLLGFDEEHRVLLLGFAPGRTGRAALAEGEAPERLLSAAGAWLQVFHAARAPAEGQFDALGALARLPQRPDCAEPAGYHAALTGLRAAAAHLQGTGVRHACLHGDMTLANLLFDGARVTGIDFENLRHHPAERDIGELWADLLLHLPAPPAEAGVLPAAWEKAFARGYPALRAPIAGFYTRHRLLGTWAAIPPRAQNRGPRRARQLQYLRALSARGAFA